MPPEVFTVSWGKHVGAVDPATGDYKPRVEFEKHNLIELLTAHITRSSKDGPYLTRPMGNGGYRSDENAEPWSLVPVDVDDLQPNEVATLIRWCDESKLAGCLATTFSHRPDLPKIRIWFFANRPVLASEHAFVHRALTRLLPFRTDPCMNKPSQPAFLPSCPPVTANEAFSRVLEGDPLDIDRLLEGLKEEIEEEQRRRAERLNGVGSGVRQPGGLVEFFNEHYPLRGLLEKHGYKRRGTNRYIAPASRSNRAAVVLYDHSLISFHDPQHDPLAARNKFGQGIVLDTFATFCKLDHRDDFKGAFREALKWARTQGWEEISSATARPTAPPPLLLNALDVLMNSHKREMLVEGILDQGSIVIAVGESNSGKTTVLQYLALQIAQGAMFGAHKTKQGRVLWIAGEDIENAKYRIVAMCEEYQIDPATLKNELLLLPQAVSVLQPNSMLALQEGIKQRCGNEAEFALVVLDSKSANWGGQDENSNDENAAFVLALRKYLIEPLGNPAVIVTHHFTKHKEKEARSARGASALINNIDHEWRFDMNQDARLSGMSPGSKVRMERWLEQRFLIKTVELSAKKFPQLINNFGATPRVSVAEPVNQYNKSIRELQQDSEQRTLLMLHDVERSARQIAVDANWIKKDGKPDVRKVRRLQAAAVEQKLLEKKDENFILTDAGKAYVAGDWALENIEASSAPGDPEMVDEEDDAPDN